MTITKPILLDETGQNMVQALIDMKNVLANTETVVQAKAEINAEAEAAKTAAVNTINEIKNTFDQDYGHVAEEIDSLQGDAANIAGRFGGMEDIMLPALVSHYGMDETLKMYVQSMQDYVPIADLCDKFFSSVAKSVKETYTSEFWKFEENNSGAGWKLDDNESLVCVPSTGEVAGQDDYATLPLFCCYDVNYTIDDSTLEPVIHAIRGVHDSFTLHPEDSFVGVLQMTGWTRRTVSEQKKKVEYAAHDRGPGWEPLPEGVKAKDNSVRGYVIHAKYPAGINAAGLPTSASGLHPAASVPGRSTNMSHDGQINLWKAWGPNYCGFSLVDIAFLQLMLEIKYAQLGNDSAMKGCQNYYLGKPVAIPEENTTRAIVSVADGNQYLVGSCVSLGSADTRYNADAYDVADTARIVSIEEIDIDGSPYKALNLDVPAPFTTLETTRVVTNPWATGSTDSVLGNDGSIYNNMSGKEPYKIQGIEVQVGLYEIPADTTLNQDSEKYTVYLNRRAADIRSGSNGVNPIVAGEMLKSAVDNGWRGVAELDWLANNQEAYMASCTFGGNTGNSYRASRYLNDTSTTSGWLEWLAFGHLYHGASCGLAYGGLIAGLGYYDWGIGGRACGTAGNRGEFTREAA